jgi:hypothetical protein
MELPQQQPPQNNFEGFALKELIEQSINCDQSIKKAEENLRYLKEYKTLIKLKIQEVTKNKEKPLYDYKGEIQTF